MKRKNIKFAPKIIVASIAVLVIAFIVGAVLLVMYGRVKVHFAYVNTLGHVMYDGKDMGEGGDVKISDGHIGFIRIVNEVPHFIYDGNDVGVIGDKTTDQRIYWALFDISADNYAFEGAVAGGENGNHVFYNGKDVGEGECFKIDGDDYVMARKADDFYKLVFNGEIVGNLYDQKSGEDGMGSICYSFFVRDKHVFYLDPQLGLYRDGEYLGRVDYDVFRGDGVAHDPWFSKFSASGENYCFFYSTTFGGPFRIVYNGKDVGFGEGCQVSGSHFGYVVYNQDLDVYDVMYDGKDMGEGQKFLLSGNDIAFTRMIGGKQHVMFNGRDLGEGDLDHLHQGGPSEDDIISDGNIVFLRGNEDWTTNVIYNGVDYGKGDFARVAGNSLAFIRKDSYELVVDGKNIEDALGGFVLSK